MAHKPWTNAEILTLRNARSMSKAAFSEVLKGRTRDAIRQKAFSLGVSIPRLSPMDRWRGKLPVPPHCHPLVRQFFGIINREKVHLFEVADRVGSSRATLSGWRYRANPRLDIFIAALNSVGYDLAIVPLKEQEAAA